MRHRLAGLLARRIDGTPDHAKPVHMDGQGLSGQGRALGSFETAAALTHDNWPFLAVGVIRLERGLTDECLRRSLDAMQAQTPLLRARVVKDSAGARFSLAGTPRIPLEVQIRRGEGDWQA